MATTGQAHEELVRRNAAEQTDANVEGLDEILAPDYVIHNPAFEEMVGREELDREGYKELIRDNHEEHGDWTQTVRDVSVDVDDGRISERTQLTGTLTEEEVGELWWADGREFTVNMNRYHRVEDGRLAETWEVTVPTDTPEE